MSNTFTSLLGSSLFGQNYIINGNFDYWQRGTSLGSGTGNRFLADRHRTFSEVSTYEVSRQSFTLGQTDVPNEPTYFIRNIVASGSTSASRCSFIQTLEDVRTLAGETVTLSFWVKADSNKNISIEFLQMFASGGSPSASVNSIGVQKIAITSSWQKITVTANLPSIAGKTLGTNGNSRLDAAIYFDAGSDYNARTDSLGNQSGTFDIAQVKLEKGSYATDFSLAGGNLAGELVMCQRYYKRFQAQGNGNPFSTGYGESTTVVQIHLQFWQNPMRATPTISLGTVTDFDLRGGGVAINATSFSGTFLFPTGCAIDVVVASGIVAGRYYVLRSKNANAFIGLDAELL